VVAQLGDASLSAVEAAVYVVPQILNNPKPDGNLSVECFESVSASGSFLLLRKRWTRGSALTGSRL
jgi:hypothetical protein